MIKSLKENEIFVFGSNTSGRHGAGAAKFAKQNFGAVFGQGEGLQGQSYAIPTRHFPYLDEPNRIETLPIKDVANHINKFIEFAKDNSNLTFLVTEVGCGLAGWNAHIVAPLFREARKLDNVVLPETFVEVLSDNCYVYNFLEEKK